MMDDYRSEDKLNEDQYVLEERRYYLNLLQTKRETSRQEVKDRIVLNNLDFNKNIPEDKVGNANWEEIIETLGYTIVRNKLFQEIKDYTTYHGSRTINPMGPCLVKVFLSKDHKKNYNIKSLERVAKIVLSLKHDRIASLIGAIEVKQTEKMYFFEELVKMPLSTYFKTNKQAFDVIKAKTWFVEIASGVLYLHNLGFAHQKLNLDCVYVKQSGDGIKIGCPDALCEYVTYDMIKATSKFSDVQRPLKRNHFSSFDLCFGDLKSYDPMAADIWACGVLLYYFLTLKFPFNNLKNKKEFNTEVQCKRWSFVGLMDTAPKLDEDTKVFLSKIFVSSPEARLTIHEILVDYYLMKKTEVPPPPPPLPPVPPPPPQVKTDMENEFEWVHNERQNNMNQLRAFHDSYNENYRYKTFVSNLQKEVMRTSLTIKEFEKANCEEGIAKDAKIMRTNLIHEANEAQLYEGIINEEHCYVKVDSSTNFVKKYHVKNLELHVKLMLQLNNPEKFVHLIKCYSIQNKIYLFIKAYTSLSRLSEKFQADTPINISLARAWTRQLIDTLYYLHKQGLTLPYLDPEYIYIKNENLLLIGQTESVFSVFAFDETAGSKTTFPTKNILRIPFNSPESLFTDSTFDPFASDIWTVAAIVYNLLFLRCPFEVKVKKIYFEQIEQKRWLHIFDKKYKLDNDFFTFFDSIFVENPEARPTSIELLFSNVCKIN